jgi:uncharacterized Zn finger protein
MHIPLHHFEDYIDETILRRGLSYYKNGQVHEPEEMRTGEYEAVVEGTKDYTVRMTVSNGVVTEHVCNCPYDMGPICKHVVAVIFYIQQDELDLTQKPVKTKPVAAKKKKKRKTVAEQVDELLEKATHDELKQFMREQARLNIKFRNLFLSSFVQYNADESKEFYEKQIKAILRSAKESDGSFDWYDARQVGNGVDHLLELAKKQIDNQNFNSAVLICTAIMEQMVGALDWSSTVGVDFSPKKLCNSLFFLIRCFENLKKVVPQNC